MNWPKQRRQAGLRVRLSASYLLVIAVGAVTLLVVARFVAPPLFAQHLADSGETDPAVLDHAQQAFETASIAALGLATLLAVLTAFAVTLFVVRRITGPIIRFAEAADQLADGSQDVEVVRPDLGPEFDRLADAFNATARQLAVTERTRQRMMADLAHDMRTPAATLAAYVDGLEDGVVLPGTETWATMREQVGRLQRLMEDLSTLSAAEEQSLSLHRARVDLRSVIQNSQSAAAPRFSSKGVLLQVSRADTELPVDADAQRLQQIFGNLLDNALRHTPRGGHVWIDANLAGDAGTVDVVVTDDGEGVAVEQQHLLFERFHRVDAARAPGEGGSGLGLTIARTLVVAHGGQIQVTSDGIGHGTSFRVSLPLAAAMTIKPTTRAERRNAQVL